MEFPEVVLWSVPAFILLLVVEIVSYKFHGDDDELGYTTKDTAASLSMGLGSLFWDVVWARLITIAGTSLVYTASPLRIEFSWALFPLFLLAQDFCYYWSHRSHHMIRFLWASHVVHHSSQRFNLSTALRQPWTGFTSWLFYLPMAALGVHPAVIAFCGSVNLVYQFWIHTERINKMWAWFELLFNTPSHHRVHHGAQGGYLDRNFGGVLIVWDRLFGTFTPETERVIYGLTKNIDTYNPLRVAYHEYASIARDLKAAKAWRDRFDVLIRRPGWIRAEDPTPQAAQNV
jgi:sterol desaturase/sphingolipid hydroxylase (fatty acid hydroxylase superfamily)